MMKLILFLLLSGAYATASESRSEIREVLKSKIQQIKQSRKSHTPSKSFAQLVESTRELMKPLFDEDPPPSP